MELAKASGSKDLILESNSKEAIDNMNKLKGNKIQCLTEIELDSFQIVSFRYAMRGHAIALLID